MGYLDLYGLSKPPFTGSADVRSFLLLNANRHAFERLVDHMINGRGVVVLRGQPGAGKTMMLTAAAQSAADLGQRIVRPDRPPIGPLTLPHLLSAMIDPTDKLSGDDPVQAAINTLTHPPRAAIVVDDVDLLTKDVRSTLIFILSQVNDSVAVVLSATSAPQAFSVRSDRTEVWLPRLNAAEVREYIERMLWIAGGTSRRLITPAALRLIVAHSQGLPGAVNRLMSAAFTTGFARSETVITHHTVNAVIANSSICHGKSWSDRFARAMQIIALLLLMIGAAAFIYRALTGDGAIQHGQHAPGETATKP